MYILTDPSFWGQIGNFTHGFMSAFIKVLVFWRVFRFWIFRKSSVCSGEWWRPIKICINEYNCAWVCSYIHILLNPPLNTWWSCHQWPGTCSAQWLSAILPPASSAHKLLEPNASPGSDSSSWQFWLRLCLRTLPTNHYFALFIVFMTFQSFRLTFGPLL